MRGLRCHLQNVGFLFSLKLKGKGIEDLIYERCDTGEKAWTQIKITKSKSSVVAMTRGRSSESSGLQFSDLGGLLIKVQRRIGGSVSKLVSPRTAVFTEFV